jgi:uncharacterized FlaG/YvyC family protein
MESSMEVMRTAANNNLPGMRGMTTSAAPRLHAEESRLPQESAGVESPAPTMIDIAAARSIAWMMNHLLRSIGTSLEFVVQATSGDIVVRVLDKATGELIRHIPAEALPDVAAILEQSHGGLINDMA